MSLTLNRNIKFLKIPTNSFDCTDIRLLDNNHWHVVATHVPIFRVARTRIQPQL